MLKKTLSVFLVSAGVMLSAAENLLPQIVTGDKTSWREERNAICQCTFAANGDAQTLTLDVTSEKGYSNYRHTIADPPMGFYTCDVAVSEAAGGGSKGIEVYLFDSNNKPIQVVGKYLAKNTASGRLQAIFAVPGNMKSLRFGLCINGNGKAVFTKPVLTRSKNLLPPLQAHKSFWEEARNAAARGEYKIDIAQGTMKLKLNSTSGYINYRYTFRTPQPGSYTLDVTALSGECASASIGVEVYVFDANGKPRAVALKYFPKGKLENKRMTVHFTVPENTRSLRVGLCQNKKGHVTFNTPWLVPGKLSADEINAMR